MIGFQSGRPCSFTPYDSLRLLGADFSGCSPVRSRRKHKNELLRVVSQGMIALDGKRVDNKRLVLVYIEHRRRVVVVHQISKVAKALEQIRIHLGDEVVISCSKSARVC
jgi:CRISPR/Cas system-associated exonuclease Cas4 (RecB family)